MRTNLYPITHASAVTNEVCEHPVLLSKLDVFNLDRNKLYSA